MLVQLNAELHSSRVQAGDEEQILWYRRAAQSILLATKRGLHRESMRGFGKNVCLAVMNVQDRIE